MNDFNFDILKLDSVTRTKLFEIVSDAVDDYIKKAEKPFTYDTICDEIEAMFPSIDSDDVIAFVEIALTCNPLIAKVENAPECPLITPVSVFYKGKSFCVVPSIEDIEKCKLFPGFLFYPFIGDEIDGVTASIRSGDCEIEIAVKTETISFAELLINCYKDYSGFSLVKNREELFSNDKPINDDIGAEIYEVDVYDMKEYFEKVSFKGGDVLVFTVEDYFARKLKFCKLSKEQRFKDLKMNVKWIHGFIRSLEEVADDDWFDSNIYTQLDEAFVKNPRLLENPFLSLYEIVVLSGVISILENHDGIPIIWRKNKPLPKKPKAPAGKKE
jgi:hypothetical protein